ncbi:MAG: hypothetical protein U0984_04145, partial [Prosthecobacter sp.]|nr:hypothetical protein [Prosthecobacter sp.]
MRLLLPALLALSPLLQAAEDMRALIEQYDADASLLNRHWAASDDSAKALQREQKLWEVRLQKLKAVDFAKLRPDQQVDYILMRNDLEATLLRLRDNRTEHEELAPWLPFRPAIEALGDARVGNEPLVPEKAAAALAPLPKAIQDILAKLKTAREKKPAAAPAKPEAVPPTPAPKPFPAPTPYQAMRAAGAVDQLADSLKKWFTNYEGFLPDFYWWAKQPYDETAKALEGYSKYLREEVAGEKSKDDGPLLGRPIGEKELQEQLGHEFIPYTPQELIAIGEREFAWCEAEM